MKVSNFTFEGAIWYVSDEMGIIKNINININEKDLDDFCLFFSIPHVLRTDKKEYKSVISVSQNEFVPLFKDNSYALENNLSFLGAVIVQLSEGKNCFLLLDKVEKTATIYLTEEKIRLFFNRLFLVYELAQVGNEYQIPILIKDNSTDLESAGYFIIWKKDQNLLYLPSSAPWE